MKIFNKIQAQTSNLFAIKVFPTQFNKCFLQYLHQLHIKQQQIEIKFSIDNSNIYICFSYNNNLHIYSVANEEWASIEFIQQPQSTLFQNGKLLLIQQKCVQVKQIFGKAGKKSNQIIQLPINKKQKCLGVITYTQTEFLLIQIKNLLVFRPIIFSQSCKQWQLKLINCQFYAEVPFNYEQFIRFECLNETETLILTFQIKQQQTCLLLINLLDLFTKVSNQNSLILIELSQAKHFQEWQIYNGMNLRVIIKKGLDLIFIFQAMNNWIVIYDLNTHSLVQVYFMEDSIFSIQFSIYKQGSLIIVTNKKILEIHIYSMINLQMQSQSSVKTLINSESLFTEQISDLQYARLIYVRQSLYLVSSNQIFTFVELPFILIPINLQQQEDSQISSINLSSNTSNSYFKKKSLFKFKAIYAPSTKPFELVIRFEYLLRNYTKNGLFDFSIQSKSIQFLLLFIWNESRQAIFNFPYLRKLSQILIDQHLFAQYETVQRRIFISKKQSQEKLTDFVLKEKDFIQKLTQIMIQFRDIGGLLKHLVSDSSYIFHFKTYIALNNILNFNKSISLYFLNEGEEKFLQLSHQLKIYPIRKWYENYQTLRILLEKKPIKIVSKNKKNKDKSINSFCECEQTTVISQNDENINIAHDVENILANKSISDHQISKLCQQIVIASEKTENGGISSQQMKRLVQMLIKALQSKQQGKSFKKLCSLILLKETFKFNKKQSIGDIAQHLLNVIEQNKKQRMIKLILQKNKARFSKQQWKNIEAKIKMCQFQ